MDNINALTRLVLWLLVAVAGAIVVARYADTVISLLLGVLLLLVIARLAWPSRKR